MKIKTTLFVALFMLLQVVLFAQSSKVIKGVVTDSKTKETLPGVTVLVEGTTIGATTNEKGEFSIKVEGEGKSLVVKFHKVVGLNNLALV